MTNKDRREQLRQLADMLINRNQMTTGSYTGVGALLHEELDAIEELRDAARRAESGLDLWDVIDDFCELENSGQ